MLYLVNAVILYSPGALLFLVILSALYISSTVMSGMSSVPSFKTFLFSYAIESKICQNFSTIRNSSFLLFIALQVSSVSLRIYFFPFEHFWFHYELAIPAGVVTQISSYCAILSVKSQFVFRVLIILIDHIALKISELVAMLQIYILDAYLTLSSANAMILILEISLFLFLFIDAPGAYFN